VRAPLVALLALVWVAPAGAASLTLSEAETREALAVGSRSVVSETFGAEWEVRDGAGRVVSVLTPFHRLALAARLAAFKREPLGRGEPARLLREQRGRLVLWVSLRGGREDFARYYAPRLLVGERQVKPAFVQNERTAARQEDGSYLAKCLYAFPTQDLTGRSRLVLAIDDGEGREVTRFTIDLATMR
jgi:hypothetical protein